MNVSRRTVVLRILMTGLLLPAAASICHASLGRAPTAFPNASTNAVRAHVMAASSTAGASYTVNSSVLPNGTTVREYVGADGLVFAVGWNGPFQPDLRTLLGDHFATMTSEAARRPRAGHSQLHIERPEVTIESTGHMRAYAGRAWVNAMLPAGFNTQDIE